MSNIIDVSMRAVAARVRDHSEDSDQIKFYLSDRNIERVEDVSEYSTAKKPFDNRLIYLCSYKEIEGKDPEDVPENLFCCCSGAFPDPATLGCSNVIFASRGYSAEEIYDYAFSVDNFIGRNGYSGKLLDALYSGQPDELCRVGSNIVGNPLLILGSDNIPVAICDFNSTSEEILDVLKNDAEYFENIDFAQTVKTQGGLGILTGTNVKFCFSTVTIKDIVVGYIIALEDNVKIQTTDENILENIGKAYRTMQFGTEQQVDSARLVFEYALLKELTDKYNQNRKVNSRYFEVLGYKFKSRLQMLTINSMSTLDNTEVKNIMVATAQHLRKVVGKNGLCTPIRDYVVVFLNCDTDDEIAATLEDIKKFCIRNDMRAGISEPFDDGEDLRRCHRQALDSLALGTILFPESNMVYFEQIRLYRIVGDFVRNYEAEDLIPNCLKKLVEYDRNNNTNLVETLEYYIYTVKNSKKAADLLHIHRNTLLYRLEKIYEIMGVDLEDGNLFIELGIAYKVMEMLARQDGRRLCFSPIHLDGEDQ